MLDLYLSMGKTKEICEREPLEETRRVLWVYPQ